MSKKSFLIGTFILATAGIISRFIGFFYRIFLSHTLGAAGLGIFQLSVPVQSLLIAISAGGIQTAISRLSASAIALKDSSKAKDYFLLGSLLSFSLSVLLSTVLYRNADFVSTELLKESQTHALIKILAFSLPLSTLHICISSYYYAQKKTGIPSFIQLLEQCSKVLSTYLLFTYAVSHQITITPVIAGLGALLSEIISVIACISFLKYDFSKANIRVWKISKTFSKLKSLVQLAFPLTLNRILLTLLGSIEVILIPQQLASSGMNSAHALAIYGTLSGMALPLIHFPATLTGSAAIMLMPSVTELNTLGRTNQLRRVIFYSYKYVFSLGSMFMFFFFFFGNVCADFLFHNVTAGIFIKTLAFACPFLYLNTTLSSILHGLGKMGTCLLYNSISACIRIFSVIFFIPIHGIQGYLYGVILSEMIKSMLFSLFLYRFSRLN